MSSVWQVPNSFTEEARPWRRERVFKSSISPRNWSFQRPLLPQQRRVESQEPTQKADPQRHKAGTLWSWRSRPHEKPTRYVCPFSTTLLGDIPQWAVMAVPGLPKHALFLSPGQGLVACGPGSPQDLEPEPPEQRMSRMQHRGAPPAHPPGARPQAQDPPGGRSVPGTPTMLISPILLAHRPLLTAHLLPQLICTPGHALGVCLQIPHMMPRDRAVICLVLSGLQLRRQTSGGKHGSAHDCVRGGNG